MASATPDKKAFEKKWGPETDRDLLMVMLCANSTNGTVSANWAAVEHGMKVMGYDFSKSAINQRFGKVILRGFRTDHGDDIVKRIAGNNAADGTPSKATPKTTPRSAKRASSAVKNENDDGTPSKKPRGKKASANYLTDFGDFDEELPIKTESGGPVKTEDPKDSFQGAVPPIDQDEEYATWLAEQKKATDSASQEEPVPSAGKIDDEEYAEWMARG